jgi:DNA/RNA endonuclease G (NUC1)
LKQLAPVIQRARASGELADTDIPEAMRPYLDALDQKALPSRSPLPANAELIRGYDPAFLQAATGQKSTDGQYGGIVIPLPKLTDSALAGAYDNGKPVNYVNFSVVMSKSRRSPILAAVNLQRSALIPLLRANVPFQYDPRVPHDAQLDPRAFSAPDIDLGQLVNAREIAWGQAFGTDAASTGQIASAMVNVMPNVTPQFDTFNRGVWLGAERYARENFNQLSDRVTIFTGPIFADDDPTVGGLRLPRQFWKILVTTAADNAASLVVEAYLVSQFGDDGAKVALATKFIPNTYRARVIDIEYLTGLDFGQIVRGGDRDWLSTPIANAAQVPTAGGDVTARLPDVTGADSSVRKRAMQEILDAIRNPDLGESNLRKLIEGIVALSSQKSFASLAPEARVNVLTLLAAIPKERWDADGWIDLKAAARRSVADAAVTLGDCSAATQACAQIALLKPKLGWDLAAGRTIYLQFAGMVREDVKSIAERLKPLGWLIPGEERTGAAAGYNEIRYGDDDDRRAAELLAADLRALGRSSIRAKKASGVKSKIPEIWISI